MKSLAHQEGKYYSDTKALFEIPCPSATDNFIPLPHYVPANLIMTLAHDLLPNNGLIGQRYSLARKGNQLFGVLLFQTDSSEMAMSIAFRNSYDQSLTFGLAFGAHLCAGESLCLSSDIVAMKKHTRSLRESLDESLTLHILKAKNHYEKILSDSFRLKRRTLDDQQAFQIMGLLFGNNSVSPRQLTALRKHWLHPQLPTLAPRNAWSLLNATAHVLKTTPPGVSMERYISAYRTIAEI